MQVSILYLNDLEIKLLESSKLPENLGYASFSIQLPKFLLWDFLCEGVSFQQKDESTPHLFYSPKDWHTGNASGTTSNEKIANTHLDVLRTLHKALETYTGLLKQGVAPSIAIQVLPSSNVVTVAATATLPQWRKWIDVLRLNKREEYVHVATKVKGLLDAS